MSKLKPPSLIPKMNFEKGIPEEKATFVVIPTILKSKEKVEEMFRKLEVYYIANKSDNIFFALLGDCSEEQFEKMDFDDEVISCGIECIQKLNEKYKTEKFSRFHFLYRKRVWNDGEKAFIGWERKRGLLSTFNKYIKGTIENNFLSNSIEKEKKDIPQIKYIITLDSDTDLSINSAHELIGTMAHILNKPEVENGVVKAGYGLIQSRVGINLDISYKTLFTKIFAGMGGIDCYSNAISDTPLNDITY